MYEIEFIYRGDSNTIVSEKRSTDIHGIGYSVQNFVNMCIRCNYAILEINVTEQKRAERKYL